jgi:hypothetical protein
MYFLNYVTLVKKDTDSKVRILFLSLHCKFYEDHSSGKLRPSKEGTFSKYILHDLPCLFVLEAHLLQINKIIIVKLTTISLFSVKFVPVLNSAPRHEDVLGMEV